MTTPLIRPESVVDIDGTDHTPADGSTVRLAMKDVPYARASIVLPILPDSVLDFLDPRDDVRVPLTVGSSARPFDLGLRTCTIAPDQKTVTLSLASDEAKLMRYAPLADDRTPLGLASSIRAVVNHVLGTVDPGASLEAGSDASVAPYWSTTNLLRSPSAETSTTEYGATGMSVLRVTTPAPVAGTYCVRINRNSGAGNVSIFCCDPADLLSASPGQTYTFAIYVRSAVARSTFPTIRFYNQDGGSLLQVNGASITSSTSAWTRVSITATAPAGTARVAPIISFQNAASATEYHYVDAGILVQGEFITDYFDGDSTDTADYLFDWSGTAHDSTTVRTLLTDKPDPEALVWRAGQTAWDFLLALTASVGMVLWCDELRNWWLATPDDRAIGSQVNVSASNTRSADDTLSIDDTDSYATGIVARYTWTDRDGIQRERVDSAGTPDVVVVEELNRPYPGPGVAAAMLARRQGTGRVQEVTAITVISTTPGMSAAISLPGAPDTMGTVTAVDFNLADGFMDLETSGLVEVTAGDWLALDPELDWSDINSLTNWTGM